MESTHKSKDWIIIAAVVVISSLVICLMSQKPNFLFGFVSQITQEEFVENYDSHIPDGWKIVNIEELGLISIPQTLEVREEGSLLDIVSKNFNETIYSISELTEPNSESSFVIQQAGLNELDDNSFSSYARVMINIYNSEDDDLPNRWERLNFSEEDLETVRQQSLSALEEMADFFNCSLGETTIEEVYINRMNAIKFTYSRTCRENPEVYVQQYKFFNHDQMVEIILSYRLTESDRWEKDFSRIIDTFILTN